MIEESRLQQMLNAAAELAVKKYRIEKGEDKLFISQNEAFRRFGRELVTRWRNECLIRPTKDGEGSAKMRYNLMELEKLASTSNRSTYTEVKYRKLK